MSAQARLGPGEFSHAVTMRLRVHYRIVLILVQAVIPAMGALLIWTPAAWSPATGNSYTPRLISVPVFALAIAAWLWLAGRTWRESVTLTRDTVVIRNVFRTSRLALAAVTGAGFGRGALWISVAGPAASSGRHSGGRQVQVAAVRLGAAHCTGRRTGADEFAAAVADAAGLAPLPPRTKITSSRDARTGLAAGAVLLAIGGTLAALTQSAAGLTGLAVRLPGWCLLYGAGLMLFPGFMVAVDRLFGRWRDPEAAAAAQTGQEAGTGPQAAT